MVQVSNKGGPDLGSVLTVPTEKVARQSSSVGTHFEMGLQILQVVGSKITIQADQLETETPRVIIDIITSLLFKSIISHFLQIK